MRILLTGGTGMLGQAVQRLSCNHPTLKITAPSSTDLNLLNRPSINQFLSNHHFDCIIHCAAKVGGIKANMDSPVEFLSDNMMISINLIEEARAAKIPRFLNIGSSCMYPRDYKMPLREDYLLHAPLEPTNEGYALAKISATRLCSYINTQYHHAYKTIIPCNLYGPGDHFDPIKSHLIAAILLKIHTATHNNTNSVEIWGDGTARREFIYVDDLADFILKIIPQINHIPDVMNVGLGYDHSINDYYNAAKQVIGYTGHFHHDLTAPVGMTQKLMDITKATHLGWQPTTSLTDGLRLSYEYYLDTKKRLHN